MAFCTKMSPLFTLYMLVSCCRTRLRIPSRCGPEASEAVAVVVGGLAPVGEAGSQIDEGVRAL